MADQYTSFGQGLQSGVNLVAGVSEMKERQRAREWEKDLTLMRTGFEAAAMKGVTQESRLKILSNVGKTYQKYYGDNPFADLKLQQLPKADEFIKFANDAISQAQKSPDKASFLLGEVVKQAGAFKNVLMEDKESLSAFEQVSGGAQEYLKGLSDRQNKKEDASSKPEFSEPQAIQAQQKLLNELVQGAKGMFFDETTRTTVDLTKNPELRQNFIRDKVNTMNSMNDWIKSDKNKKIYVTQSEIDERKKSGELSAAAIANIDKLVKSGRYVIVNDF